MRERRALARLASENNEELTITPIRTRPPIPPPFPPFGLGGRVADLSRGDVMLHRLLRTSAAIAALTFLPSVASAQIEDPLPDPIPRDNVRVGLATVAGGLTAPNFGTYAPGLPGYLFVTDQNGVLWAIHLPSGLKSSFLDVGPGGLDLIVALGARPTLGLDFDERGLLGVAFHPRFHHNGKLYTFTSEPIGPPADFPIDAELAPEVQAAFDALGLTFPNHQSVISEWRARDPSNPAAGVDPASRRVILRIDQPQFNHNSGALAFGPDGMLYATIGDGGGADDQPEQDMQDFLGVPILGHGESGNAQNPGNILGTLIRIDPHGNNAPNGQYGIPQDNPFFAPDSPAVGGMPGCADGLCDEIYAYGFRNAFRFSFDMRSGTAFVADVGQNDIEEVNIAIAGANYGWKLKEGTFLFDHNGDDGANGLAFVSKDSPGVPVGMVDPIAQYDHDEGVAVVGGFVYRGRTIGRLRGRYVFGDFSRPPFDPFGPGCQGRLFSLDRKVNRHDLARLAAGKDAAKRFSEFPGDLLSGFCLLGFAQDAFGEIYALVNRSGLPMGQDGLVLRLVRR